MNVGDSIGIVLTLHGTTGELESGNPAGGLAQFGIHGSYDTTVFEPDPANPSVFYIDSVHFTGSPVLGAGSFDVSGVHKAAFSPGVFGSGPPGNVSVLLGTIYLRAKTAGTGTLNITDPNSGTDNFKLGSGSGVDADVFSGAPYQFTANPSVSAVPEPGSLSLVALAGGGLWWAKRRRRSGTT